MRERPILFSAPMVRATLDGRKTQTRRYANLNDWNCPPGMVTPNAGFSPRSLHNHRSYCPFGQPGARLWVRETWRIGAWNEDGGEIAVDYLADNHSRREWLQVPEADDFEKYWLQCCDDCNKAGVKTDDEGKYHWEPGQSPCRIRPSIFMPRWASRITFEITGVRIERLQEISEVDAKAEGVSSVAEYIELWKSINKSWEPQTWVWVISFNKLREK